MATIKEWLITKLADHSTYSEEELLRDCEEILHSKSIDPEALDESVLCKNDVLLRLKKWQQDKEYLASLDLHAVIARQMRKSCRENGCVEDLNSWKVANIGLNEKEIAEQIIALIKEKLNVQSPLINETNAVDKFTTEFHLGPVDDFHRGLEMVIGYPVVNIDFLEAMKKEHERGQVFDDNFRFRRVDPKVEWNIVMRGQKWKIPEVGFEHTPSIPGRSIGLDLDYFVGISQRDFAEAGLDKAEIAGLRLWTGPMYAKYAKEFRKRSKDTSIGGSAAQADEQVEYVNTMHAINSGITKLTRVWKIPRDRKVYRGYNRLKMQELKKNACGCKGGVEYSVLATSESREVAMSYAEDSAFVLEIMVGQVNKGADVSWLSQFPEQKEILFNALSNVEFLGSPQQRFLAKEGSVQIYSTQITSNGKSKKLEEYLNLRKDLHLNTLDWLVNETLRIMRERMDDTRCTLLENIFVECQAKGVSISQEATNADAGVFNEFGQDYVRLIEEIRTFPTHALSIADMVSSWFKTKEATPDVLNEFVAWQLEALSKACGCSYPHLPPVKTLIFENWSRNFEGSVFHTGHLDLGIIGSSHSRLAVAKLLFLSPAVRSIDMCASWAPTEIWLKLFRDLVLIRPSGLLRINNLELKINRSDFSKHPNPCSQELKLGNVRETIAAGRIAPALMCKPTHALTSLSLYSCPIACEGAELIGQALQCLTGLTYLQLSNCGIGDRGCIGLASNLMMLSQLTVLDVSYNKVRDKGFLALTEAVTTLTALKPFNMKFNPTLLPYFWRQNKSCFVAKAATTNAVARLRGKSPVRCLSWSPDGAKIAAGCLNMTIIVWNAQTEDVVRFCRKDAGRIGWVAWSPDGSRIAAACRNNVILIWNARTGGLDCTLSAYRAVFAVEWSPDGSKIASASYDENVTVWDANTREQLKVLKGDSGVSVSWSPDGTRIASGSLHGGVSVWSAKGSRQYLLKGHSGVVTAAVWSPDGSLIASAARVMTAVVWDAKIGTLKFKLHGHVDNVRSVTWSPDGSMIATGSWDRSIIIWDPCSGNQISFVGGHSASVYAVGWSPDGSKIASGSYDSSIVIWDVTKAEEVS